MMYIYEQALWPIFTWDHAYLEKLLAEVRYRQGKLRGSIDVRGDKIRQIITNEIVTIDAIESSAIEGEKLNYEQVHASIAKGLSRPNISTTGFNPNTKGISAILINATEDYNVPLTKERLFLWHNNLFSTDHNGLQRIHKGGWRGEASREMQIVSGPLGYEEVHYVAPSYKRLEEEMERFIAWFNALSETDLLIKAAIAHFWFVTIHPFDDGNGRIARALADIILAQSERSAQRFYDMSSQINREKDAYYHVLEQQQKGTLDITLWIEWFLKCLDAAISTSEKKLDSIIIKEQFWKTQIQMGHVFNPRQYKLINALLEGFEGKLTSSKWAKIAKCSQDTALRDITDLLERKILTKEEAGGRSTSYMLHMLNTVHPREKLLRYIDILSRVPRKALPIGTSLYKARVCTTEEELSAIKDAPSTALLTNPHPAVQAGRFHKEGTYPLYLANTLQTASKECTKKENAQWLVIGEFKTCFDIKVFSLLPEDYANRTFFPAEGELHSLVTFLNEIAHKEGDYRETQEFIGTLKEGGFITAEDEKDGLFIIRYRSVRDQEKKGINYFFYGATTNEKILRTESTPSGIHDWGFLRYEGYTVINADEVL